MDDFSFIGRVPSSEDIWVRGRIVESYFPHFKMEGETFGESAKIFSAGIDTLGKAIPMECPISHEHFVLLAVRCSRMAGNHKIINIPQEFLNEKTSRLFKLLRQLGCEVVIEPGVLKIESIGWKIMGDGIFINSRQDYDVASALVLNCWALPFEMFFSVHRQLVTRPRFEMSYNLMSQHGWVCSRTLNEFYIKPRLMVQKEKLSVEADMGLAFWVGATAALSGQCSLSGFPAESLQAESFFPYVLEDFGAEVQMGVGTLVVKMGDKKYPFECDLSESESMLMLSSCLAANVGSGDSFLSGICWEDDQVQKDGEDIFGRLENVGCKILTLAKGVRIKGLDTPPTKQIKWNVEDNRKLLMAGAFLKKVGWPIELVNHELAAQRIGSVWDWMGS